MTFRYVAPSGAPIRPGDLGRWLARLGPAATVRRRLETGIAARFGVPHAEVTSTGRAAMTRVLQALRGIGGDAARDEVIVPSYTCFSVGASIVKAGLRPRIVDIAPDTLDYDPDELEACATDRVLAIVATNLYGLPNDLPRLSAFARARGLFLVDDAAQAMGAEVGGRYSGTWGDAGILSFDKGKNVSAIDGGVILTRDPRLAERLAATPLDAGRAAETASKLGKLAAYVVLLHPTMYWLPNALPQSGLGVTRYTTDFPVAAMPAALAALAEAMLTRLAAFTESRRAHAAWLLRELAPCDGLRPIRAGAGTAPVYLRCPLLARDGELRGRLLAALTRAGIGATASYPASLADVPDLQPHLAGGPARATGGRAVAERILTLPTHPFVAARDLAVMRDVVGRVTSARTEDLPAAVLP